MNVNSTELTCISLCSGYEGIGMGIKRVIPNVRTILYSEIEKYACEVLVERMEEGKIDIAPIWTNLKTLPCKQFSGKVDILTAGFPCQPFSCAGSREGTGDPRHLWPYIEKTIVDIRPRICFFENVEGIISAQTIDHLPKLKDYCSKSTEQMGNDSFYRFAMRQFGISVLHYVFIRLEAMGYRAEAGIFSASEVGAPHQRKRVFIMAYRDNGLCELEEKEIRTGWNASTTCGERWPARPGQGQHEWEKSRVI